MAYEKLKKEIEKRGISKLRLAQECRISPSYVYDVMNGKRSAYPRFKREVSNYLGMTEEELFSEKCGPWIKCSYKLPELVNDVKKSGCYDDIGIWLESDPVLVYRDDLKRIYIAILSAFDTLEEKNWINVENLETIVDVKFWMPLPNLPEEK